MNVRFAVVLVSVFATTSFADDRAEAQKQIDLAMTQRCELVQKQIREQKDSCPEEFAKIDGTDCTSRAARNAANPFKLNRSCSEKQKAKAGSGK